MYISVLDSIQNNLLTISLSISFQMMHFCMVSCEICLSTQIHKATRTFWFVALVLYLTFLFRNAFKTSKSVSREPNISGTPLTSGRMYQKCLYKHGLDCFLKKKILQVLFAIRGVLFEEAHVWTLLR